MSAIGALRGYKAFIRIGVGLTPTWTEVIGVPEFDIPDQTPSDVDVTHLTSPNDTEEAINGMKPMTTWTAQAFYIPNNDTDTALKAVVASGEIVQIEFNLPQSNGTTFVHSTYAARIKNWRPVGINPKGEIRADITATVMAQVEE